VLIQQSTSSFVFFQLQLCSRVKELRIIDCSELGPFTRPSPSLVHSQYAVSGTLHIACSTLHGHHSVLRCHVYYLASGLYRYWLLVSGACVLCPCESIADYFEMAYLSDGCMVRYTVIRLRRISAVHNR